MKSNILWDAYDRKARVYPAFFILLPLFVLHFLYLRKEFSEWTNLLTSLKSLTLVSLPLLLLYFAIAKSRTISKGIFEKLYFKESLYLPTTSFLLHSSKKLSSSYKSLLRKKIKKDFSLLMSSDIQEQEDELEARLRISEAVNLIREKTRGDEFLLKYNIQYGFSRNLIGGSVIALPISVIDLLVFKYLVYQPFAQVLSIVFIIIYTVIILTSKFVMNLWGNEYASRLYTAYLKKP